MALTCELDDLLEQSKNQQEAAIGVGILKERTAQH